MKSSQRSPMRAARLCGTGVNGAQTREPGSAEVTAKPLNTGPYQVLPDLTAEEYEALKADIAAHGIEVPIEVNERGNVLDGHHCLKAAKQLRVSDEAIPRVVRQGLSDEQKLEHVLRLNLLRRDLTREQEQALAVQLRQVDPGAHRGRAGRFTADRLQQRQCRIWNSSAAFDHHGHAGPPAAGPKAETSSACHS